ncbi:hypothetical protein ACTNCI_00095 [Mitsuokella jalaludinii]|uniref:hypothetical protein n=1 Tax=Mitsuokella jalaludinii TaxID=187979 RepID=UPI003F8B6318
MSDDAVIRAVRAAARLTVYWRKKQIAVLGGAVLLVARQTGVEPTTVLHEVTEWLEKNGKDAELR